jgi:hypothetical protein
LEAAPEAQPLVDPFTSFLPPTGVRAGQPPAAPPTGIRAGQPKALPAHDPFASFLPENAQK